jgi:hypothetical protein
MSGTSERAKKQIKKELAPLRNLKKASTSQ